VRHADRIVVLDRGRLVESGRHETLLHRGGPYESLWRVQAGLRAEEILQP
jgi:ATP-binding cassette subfamily B protein